MTTENKENKKRKRESEEADETNEEMNGEASVDTAPPGKKPKQEKGKEAKKSSNPSSPFTLTLRRTGSAFIPMGNSFASATAGSGGAGLTTQKITQQLGGGRRKPQPSAPNISVKIPLKPPASITDRTVIAAGRSVSVFLEELNDAKTTEERTATLTKELKKQEKTLRRIATDKDCTNTKRRDETLEKIKQYFEEHPVEEEELPSTPTLDDYDTDPDERMAPTT